MSTILDVDKLDGVGFADNGKTELLLLFDHLDWEDGDEHLQLLQNKLNHYLLFIQKGQKELPRWQRKHMKKAERIVIQICFEYEPSKDCVDNLAMAQKKVEPLNVELRYVVYDPFTEPPTDGEQLMRRSIIPGKSSQ